VVSLGPPQQQGVFCGFVLGVLRNLGIRESEPGSAEHVFYLAHAMRQGLYYCGMIGDPAAAEYAVDAILDDGFHATIAKIIRGLRPKIDLTKHVALTSGPGLPGTAGGKPTGGDARPKQPTGSCELAVVDREGNWVQMMNTLQSGGIPGVVLHGIPMVGSHATFTGMSGFMDAKVVKGIRPRCVIGNTMVFQGGKPMISLGSPGNVHCTVPQVLTYLLDYRFDPYRAADAIRMLPLAEDGSVTIEDRVSGATVDQLRSWGVQVRAVGQYDWHMARSRCAFGIPRPGGSGRPPTRVGAVSRMAFGAIGDCRCGSEGASAGRLVFRVGGEPAGSPQHEVAARDEDQHHQHHGGSKPAGRTGSLGEEVAQAAGDDRSKSGADQNSRKRRSPPPTSPAGGCRRRGEARRTSAGSRR